VSPGGHRAFDGIGREAYDTRLLKLLASLETELIDRRLG
jgi:hypothetical protein